MATEATSAESPKPKSGKARIKSGVRAQEIEAGKTVKETREEYKQYFNIPDGAKAHSGGRELSDDEIIGEGMSVEWIKQSGEKGDL